MSDFMRPVECRCQELEVQTLGAASINHWVRLRRRFHTDRQASMQVTEQLLHSSEEHEYS